ncbi:MAG: DUF1467 family protein [Pseudomonadota bacterium]
MTIVSAIAIYILIWWVTLFAVLPIGVRAQHDDEDGVIQGTASSAPVTPKLGFKLGLTTAISLVIFSGLSVAYQQGMISIDSIPFLPTF